MLKKWIVIGLSAGTGFAALSAAIIGGVLWRSSQEVPWNTGALSVLWSEAVPIAPPGRGRPATWEDVRRFRAGEPPVPATAEEIARWETLPNYEGFVLTFALQNHTSRDITIPSDGVRIMKRLSRQGVLADAPFIKRPERAFFIPSHQKGELSLKVDWTCIDPDADRCLTRLFDNADGLVLFHDALRIQVLLPKPSVVQERPSLGK